MVKQPKTLSAVSTLLAVLVAVSLVLSSCGQTPVVPRTIAGDELETFCDEFFPAHMEELRIPGLTFVAVQDGETLLTKGYGHASIEEDRAVDPETAVFRIGSISKVLVAAAVMQLVEKGQIDLQSDVNDYLTALQVDNPYRKHLTLAHLLTHTGGIQDPPYESNTDPSAVRPLGPFLADELPRLTSAPGKKCQCSNYGYALAGFVVEEMSGLSFDRYVEQNIFQPLGMDSTEYLLAPPAPEGMATGSATRDGFYAVEPLDYDDDYPGGSIISTAPDMAILITALLGDGCYGDACVLEASTVVATRLWAWCKDRSGARRCWGIRGRSGASAPHWTCFLTTMRATSSRSMLNAGTHLPAPSSASLARPSSSAFCASDRRFRTAWSRTAGCRRQGVPWQCGIFSLNAHAAYPLLAGACLLQVLGHRGNADEQRSAV